MSKGDWTRPVNKEKYDESFEAIFGRKELKTWDPEADVEGDSGSQDESNSGSSGPEDEDGNQRDSTG